MKFIKLTTRYQGHPLWVNIEQISYIEERNANEDGSIDIYNHYGIIAINGVYIDIELSSFYELLKVIE